MSVIAFVFVIFQTLKIEHQSRGFRGRQGKAGGPQRLRLNRACLRLTRCLPAAGARRIAHSGHGLGTEVVGGQRAGARVASAALDFQSNYSALVSLSSKPRTPTCR